jgi:type IV secretion system protein VirB10
VLQFPGEIPIGDDYMLPIVLNNSGDDPLTIQKITLGSDQDVFRLDGTCIEGAILDQRQNSCRLEVTFTPLEPRAYAIKLFITHSAENSPLVIDINGRAKNPVAPPPPVVVAPPRPTYDPSLLINSLQIQAQRRAAGLDSTATGLFFGQDYRMSSPDHDEIGYRPTESTYPVNRERMITADRYIPAVLENTINSQIDAGRIVAVVENHVYSAQGRNILIPAGSRAIGFYESFRGAGSTRLRVTWTRIIRPDGVGIDVQSPGADPMGRMGLIGEVDKRLFERYAEPLLLSLIGAIGTYATAPDVIVSTDTNGVTSTSSTQSARAQAVRQVTGDLADIAKDIIRDNIDIRPVITVPAGTRLVIMPTRDIILKKPTLLTAAGEGNDIVSKAQALIRALERGDPDATSRLVDVIGGAAQLGQRNEAIGGFGGAFGSPAIGSGMEAFGPEPGTR